MPAATPRSAHGPLPAFVAPATMTGRGVGLYVPGRQHGVGAMGTPQCRDTLAHWPTLVVPGTITPGANLPRGYQLPLGSGSAARGMHAALRTDQQFQRPLSMLWVGRTVPGTSHANYTCFAGITFDRTGATDYGVCEMQQWVTAQTYIATVSNNTTRYLFGCSSTEDATTYAATGLIGLERGETFAVSIVLSANGDNWMHANGILGRNTRGTNNAHTQPLRWGSESGPFIGRYGTNAVYGGNVETFLFYTARTEWPPAYAADLTRHPEALWSGARAALIADSGAQLLAPVLDVSAGAWFVQGV